MDQGILYSEGLYKNRLISAFLNSESICKTLLGRDIYTDDDVENLIYSQIFPFLYIDHTQTEVLPYLCFEVYTSRLTSPTIKEMILKVWCYCHKDCMKYHQRGYLGTRVDILANAVELQLYNSDKYGIGKPSFKTVNVLNSGNSKYYGKEIVFTMPDFKIKGEAK